MTIYGGIFVENSLRENSHRRQTVSRKSILFVESIAISHGRWWLSKLFFQANYFIYLRTIASSGYTCKPHTRNLKQRSIRNMGTEYVGVGKTGCQIEIQCLKIIGYAESHLLSVLIKYTHVFTYIVFIAWAKFQIDDRLVDDRDKHSSSIYRCVINEPATWKCWINAMLYLCIIILYDERIVKIKEMDGTICVANNRRS